MPRPLRHLSPIHHSNLRSLSVQVTITAVGPDNRGLADPIIHYVTGQGANIAEIQMYDHDEECLFAMLLRIELAASDTSELRPAMAAIGKREGAFDPRLVARRARRGKPRLAICATLRPEPPLALLRAIRDGHVQAEPAVMIGNRPNLPLDRRAVRACRGTASATTTAWQRRRPGGAAATSTTSIT